MFDVLIVMYGVCCITITLMCVTNVVYMIRDMIADSRADEPVDNSEDEAEEPVDDDEGAAEEPVGNGEGVTDDA